MPATRNARFAHSGGIVSTQQRTRRDPTGERFDRFRNPAANATTELVIVRHGQTAANIAGLLVGRQDTERADREILLPSRDASFQGHAVEQ